MKAYYPSLVIVFFLYGFSLNIFSQTTTITCPSIGAVSVYSGLPNMNFNGSSVSIGDDTAGEEFIGLIVFDLSSIPVNAQINDAVMTLTYHPPYGGNIGIDLHRITSNWNANTVTWNTTMSYTTSSYGTFWTWYTSSTVEVPITDIVIDWIENGNNNYGIRMIKDGGTGMTEFYSLNAPSNDQPSLEVTYTIPDPQPNLTYVEDYCNLNVNGTQVSIDARVVNNGQGSAGSSHVGYYLSEDSNVTTSDWLIGDDNVSSLSPGAYSDESISVDVSTVTPTIPPGTYKVGFIVDFLDEVEETNENDNSACWGSSSVVVPPPSSYLTVQPSSKTVSYSAGSFAVNVSSNVSWTVSESCSWVTCSPTNGVNDGSFIVSYISNPNSYSRNCIITVSGGGVNATVNLTQESIPSNWLTLSSTSKTVGIAAGSFNIIVSSNVTWSISESCNWVTCNPVSGSNNGSFTVAYTQNTGSQRLCSIVVSGGGQSETLSLTQLGMGEISINPTSMVLNHYEGSFDVNVTSNIEWIVSENSYWVWCSPTSGSNNGIFTVNYSSNSLLTDRTCSITVGYDDLVQTLFLSQDHISLGVSPLNQSVTSSMGTMEIIVNSNINWSVEEDCSWVTCSPTNGANDGVIVVDYESNQDTEVRSCDILVEGETLSKVIRLTQEGNSLYCDVSIDTVVIEGEVGSTGTFDIVSNMSWQVMGWPTWLEINHISGEGNAEIIVASTSRNETSNNKVSDLTVSGGTTYNNQVVVVQMPYVGITEQKVSDMLFIYPNPASDRIYIKNLSSEVVIESLELKNMLFETISIAEINSPINPLTFHVSNINSGIYFLIVRTSRGKVVRKVLINNW